ncbi:MAG: HAMP domain-containing histidine kinase, partial [Spirochaetes bacterium]|nr:HAMP domain-containing histidine kinase [Spirochaetota bacterium]
HHWRQPLNKIALVAQFIEDEFNNGQLNKETLSHYISDIMRLVQQMSDILQGFQSFFAKSQHDEDREYDIKFIARDIINLLKEEVLIKKPLKTRITCMVHNLKFEEESMVIPCNEFKINKNISLVEQVFLNLLKNSIESISLSEREYGELIVEFYKQEDVITVVLKDNGVGIDEDKITKIFDPFFTTKETAIHTGLGLYIVMVIVKKHLNGSIKAQN